MCRRSSLSSMRCKSKVRKRYEIRARLLLTRFPGLDCTGRLFVSDRAHLVFDFHQIVDGLKEVELGGSR